VGRSYQHRRSGRTDRVFLLALGIWQAMAGIHMKLLSSSAISAGCPVGDLQIDAAVQLDQLSMVMILVVTGVGERSFKSSVSATCRTTRVPAATSRTSICSCFQARPRAWCELPSDVRGLGGVGLCSYLLIGFLVQRQGERRRGQEAFIVTASETSVFLVAMFMLFANIGVLDFIGVNAQGGRARHGQRSGHRYLLVHVPRCTGRARRSPLYIWLPDAMAGPTPVSALIHAATMGPRAFT